MFYGVCIPEHGPVARHFAYQVLQHAISLNWATLDPAVKTNFKTVAIHCMSSWALDLEAEERFVKAAAVQFVARLMLLEWPQRYATVLAGFGTTPIR